jgi:hypothetical protein
MKKFVSMLMAVIIGLFSATAAPSTITVDTPAETKAVEWAIGYYSRCAKYGKTLRHSKNEEIRRFARRVVLLPLALLIGTASAETTPNERFWSCMARGGTREEALEAYNATDDLQVPKPKTARRASHPRWANVDPERVGFLSAEDLNDAVAAKRGWFTAARLNGFTATSVLAYQWYKPDDLEPVTKPPKKITFGGVEYLLWCAGQGGVKKGSAMYITRAFLYTSTNGVLNHVLLDAPAGLPINKVNQVRALRFTACQPTKATNKQIIVLKALRRIDKASDIVDGRPVVHVDVPNGYKMAEATEVEQGLADGYFTYGFKAGIDSPALQGRNEGGLKGCGARKKSKYLGKVITDVFGRQVEVTDQSIITTTDCHKDIKPFLQKIEDGEMTGDEAYAAWLEAQGGPDGLIYACSVHPQNGRVALGRQIFGKFSQLSAEALFRVVSKDMAKLAEMGFENGYKKALQRKYVALRIPELASALNHPLLYQDTIKGYLSRWHKIASGGVEVNGSLALAVIDPDWFDDVYIGGKSVNDSTAGVVEAGTVLFGTKNKEGINKYVGKKMVLGRFPQVKSGLPVVKVAGDAFASGIIIISGRPGDMVLQDLDADLDGDKLYAIDDEDIVEAVEKANKAFNFPHVIFSKWDTTPADETLEEYLGRNAQWQGEENVGSFATHQFVIDEMVPLLEEGQDWRSLLRPTLDENGDYSKFVTLVEIFELNILLGVAGNMATDSGKLNHKPDAPEWIVKKAAFRPMSQRDAHPNAPDSGFKKRHAAFLPDKYPGVDSGVLKRLHDLMMKYIPIHETGRNEVNDFEYDENGRILPDIPLALWAPAGFDPIPENVWRHKFGNELDQVATSLVCYPNDAQTVELNADLQVFTNGDDGISLITYFTKYATRIAAIEASLDDDKKGWTVAGRDTFGDNLIKFVQTATGRKDISDDDCLWLAYNALCQSFIGTQSQSRGTSFAISQFLRLFEGMLIQQVCHNTGSKPPKTYETKVSIKDSVTKTAPEPAAQAVEITDEEPPWDNSINTAELKRQLLVEQGLELVDEEPPTEQVDINALKTKLKWEISIDPTDDEDDVEDEE